MSAEGFLKQMDEFRNVFFQDSALLQDEFPDLIVFTHPAFQHSLWPSFKQAIINEQQVVGQNGLMITTTYDHLPAQVSLMFCSIIHLVYFSLTCS